MPSLRHGPRVPKTIDTGTVVPIGRSRLVNLFLMSVFAIQHSVMARQPFRNVHAIRAEVGERQHLRAARQPLLILLFWQWRPPACRGLCILIIRKSPWRLGTFVLGWADGVFEHVPDQPLRLFGLHQVANNLVGKPMPVQRFRTPLFYKFVRHPLYLGFSSPSGQRRHDPGAPAVCIRYHGVYFSAHFLEERDLISFFGDDYRRYRDRVSMLVPWRNRHDHSFKS